MPLTSRSPPASMNGQLPDKWTELSQLEITRQSIEASLRQAHEDSISNEKKLLKEIKRMDAYEESLQKQLDDLKSKNKELQDQVVKQADSAPFVVLLVDGDSTNFLDAFVSNGFEGASQAAQVLKRQLEQYLSESVPDYQAHWKIMVHVYANLHGLTMTYLRNRVVPDLAIAQKFFTGFNRELPFFEFIDAGNDKEAADSKIKKYLQHYHESPNCKHVLLAVSGDNSYVGSLRQWSADTAKITLVKAVPFPQSFQELAKRFKTKSFPEVFKTEKLKAASTPPSSPGPGSASVLSSSSMAASSYASITSAPTSSTTSAETAITAFKSRTSFSDNAAVNAVRIIKYNCNGERIDESLPLVDKDLVRKFQNIIDESHRPCARFYLSKCYHGNECKFDHQRKYNNEDKKAIRRLARSLPCQIGAYCDDITCVSSHSCPYGRNCDFGDRCRFVGPTHIIDLTVAEERTVYI